MIPTWAVVILLWILLWVLHFTFNKAMDWFLRWVDSWKEMDRKTWAEVTNRGGKEL